MTRTDAENVIKALSEKPFICHPTRIETDGGRYAITTKAHLDRLEEMGSENKGKDMKNMVYICSPLRGNGRASEAENIRRAINYCGTIVRLHPELIPIAPHLYFPIFMDDHDPDCRAYGMAKGIELLDLCDTIAVEGLGVTEPSEGMAKEIEYAKSHGVKIVDIEYFTRPKAAKDAADSAAAPH